MVCIVMFCVGGGMIPFMGEARLPLFHAGLDAQAKMDVWASQHFRIAAFETPGTVPVKKGEFLRTGF